MGCRSLSSLGLQWIEQISDKKVLYALIYFNLCLNYLAVVMEGHGNQFVCRLSCCWILMVPIYCVRWNKMFAWPTSWQCCKQWNSSLFSAIVTEFRLITISPGATKVYVRQHLQVIVCDHHILVFTTMKVTLRVQIHHSCGWRFSQRQLWLAKAELNSEFSRSDLSTHAYFLPRRKRNRRRKC